MNRQILFCGGGNMAEGILRSVLKKGVADSSQVTMNDLMEERCSYLQETYGVGAVTDGTAAMADADVIVIAVLPYFSARVCSALSAAARLLYSSISRFLTE